MDKWVQLQDMVEDVFGKRPDSPEMLVEYMIVMADMIIDSNQYGRTRMSEPEEQFFPLS